MKRVGKILIPLVTLLLLAGCDGRVERSDGGGVVLSITDFQALPTQVSVNGLRFAGGLLTMDQITITSILKNRSSGSSDLMNIEMNSYEVTYSRGDGGTLLPPPLVQKIFGVTPAGGSNTYDNLPIMTSDQLNAPPLSDYLIENGGFDRETGRTTTSLNFHLKFFGRSIAGEAVESNVASFTVEFTV
ncbi:MAG: hypothetical protein VYE73_03650 [Acidobacteriota bacterium]|nr:hypothetical protein [Acidobacteriota bacterium]